MITNPQSGTNVHEIAAGIYRINTPVPLPTGVMFSFNQYLVADDEPLLFHTGPRRMFPSWPRPSGGCYRWTACATSGFPTWNPTSAAP